MGESSESVLMGRRKFIVLSATAFSGAMLFGVTGCAPSAPGAEKGLSFSAGSFTGKAQGKKGAITVETVFSKSAIESIAVLESSETPRIAATPFAQIPETMIKYQSLNVDTVTGATFASNAVVEAVKDCVRQAGGSVRTLESRPAAEKLHETVEIDADVVVLGAGASGMGTAIACSQKGMKVVVMEKCGNMGGNCLVSGGMMQYIDAPTNLRAASADGLSEYFASTIESAVKLGFPEDILNRVEKQFSDWYATGTDKVFDSVEWQTVAGLVSLGIPEYSDAAWDAYYQYNAETIPLLSWLDEDLSMDFKPLTGIAGYPWPDWAQPTEGENGEGYFRAFEDYLAAQGDPIEFLFQTPADEIILDGGRAVGARGTCADGTTYIVNAAKAVVVATGGFSGSKDLLIEHDDGWGFADMDSIPTTNNFGHTGDGLKMGLAAGGVYVDGAPNIMCLPFVNAVDFSVESMVGNTGNALLVNKEGKRFVDESLGRNEIAKAQMKQTDEMCFLVSDKNNSLVEGDFNQFGIELRQLLDSGKIYRADTLEELSGLMGVDSNALVESVEKYNGFAATKIDAEFGRTMFDESSPVKKAPFYAYPCHWAVHITCSGLNVNWENYALVDESGNDIPGLYGVGEVVPTTGGIMTMSNGLVVADAISAQ